MESERNKQKHVETKTPWLDMYVYSIKKGFSDLILEYKYLLNSYDTEKGAFIITKSKYQLFNKHESHYREDILFLLNFIEDNPFKVDMLDTVTQYYNRYNITLQDLKNLAKLILTRPVYMIDGDKATLIRKGKETNG